MTHFAQEPRPHVPAHVPPLRQIVGDDGRKRLLDGCDLQENFGFETQFLLDSEFSAQNLWPRAATALENAGFFTPRDLLVAGASYVRKAKSIGPRAWKEITTNSLLAQVPIKFQDDPAPEHIAHYCHDLSRVSAAAFLGRFVRFTGEFSVGSNELMAHDILQRTVEPGDIEALFINPAYLKNPHSFSDNPAAYKGWNAANAEDQNQIRARCDEQRINTFYSTYEHKIGRFIERFNQEKQRVDARK